MDKKARVAVIIMFFIMGIFLIGLTIAKPFEDKGMPSCKDGLDNDGDNYTDWPDDPGCLTKNDRSELNLLVECDDGLDNDGDGVIDMNDFGCSTPIDTDETNCNDGVCEGGETSQSCPGDCGYLDSCQDSDNGIIPEVLGNTSGYLNGSYYIDSDFCMSNTTLKEFYCSGNYEFNYNINCITNRTTSCSNGACI